MIETKDCEVIDLLVLILASRSYSCYKASVKHTNTMETCRHSAVCGKDSGSGCLQNNSGKTTKLHFSNHRGH